MGVSKILVPQIWDGQLIVRHGWGWLVAVVLAIALTFEMKLSLFKSH
jgi:hypothetical protein